MTVLGLKIPAPKTIKIGLTLQDPKPNPFNLQAQCKSKACPWSKSCPSLDNRVRIFVWNVIYPRKLQVVSWPDKTCNSLTFYRGARDCMQFAAFCVIPVGCKNLRDESFVATIDYETWSEFCLFEIQLQVKFIISYRITRSFLTRQQYVWAFPVRSSFQI